MSDYQLEDEGKTFVEVNVRKASPEEIEAHIGDLQVRIERLRATLMEIIEMAQAQAKE